MIAHAANGLPVDIPPVGMYPAGMRNFLRSLLLLPALVISWRGVRADAPPAIPAALAVPAGQRLVLTLNARGVQIYECRATAGDPTKFEWAFKAPEADLFDVQGAKAGHHYAGPTWELADGSKVTGRMKANAASPDGKGIPWLLVEATQASGGGSGILAKVQSIQRVNTVGGKAPSEPAVAAKAGQAVRVDYAATYLFYSDKP